MEKDPREAGRRGGNGDGEEKMERLDPVDVMDGGGWSRQQPDTRTEKRF